MGQVMVRFQNQERPGAWGLSRVSLPGSRGLLADSCPQRPQAGGEVGREVTVHLHPGKRGRGPRFRTYGQTTAFASSASAPLPICEHHSPCSPSPLCTQPLSVHSLSCLPQANPCLPLQLPTMLFPSVHSHLLPALTQVHLTHLPVCLSILCLPPIILKSTLELTPQLSFVNGSAL